MFPVEPCKNTPPEDDAVSPTAEWLLETNFPPIFDTDHLLPTNENNSCSTPVTVLSPDGSESNPDSLAGRVLLPPIFIGLKLKNVFWFLV